ncbi:hypothetical protein GUITHDRAFT_79159, partial [Guillardia theta CCMP2712]
GGLELLFQNQRNLDVVVPERGDGKRPTIRDALIYLKEQHVRERPEMFLQGETVRPGILVLVNDADWELCGGAEYELQDGDALTIISTLHGG